MRILVTGSGIASRTLASWRHAWGKGFERLTSKDVLVIDEAGMIGSRELAATLRAAKDAGAKVILVGDPEQLQDKGGIQAFTTEVEARDVLLKEYLAEHAAKPERSQMILTHTRALARELNDEIRAQLQARGRLAFETRVETSRGPRDFARGDRIMFLKNDHELAVKNGLLGEVVNIQDDRMTVVLDKGKTLSFKVSDYPDIDHGYASTVHKAQGVTVDHAYVLASRGFDRQLAYVAMTQHREKLSLHYSRETFGKPDDFDRIMSRDRSKDTTLDYEATMLAARDIAGEGAHSIRGQIAAIPMAAGLNLAAGKSADRARDIGFEIE